MTALVILLLGTLAAIGGLAVGSPILVVLGVAAQLGAAYAHAYIVDRRPVP